MEENINTEDVVELSEPASRTMHMNVPVDGVRAMLEALSGDLAMFPDLNDLDAIEIRIDHAADILELGAAGR